MTIQARRQSVLLDLLADLGDQVAEGGQGNQLARGEEIAEFVKSVTRRLEISMP